MEYHFFIELKEFTLIAFSPTITTQDLERLDNLAVSINKKYVELSQKRIFPKLHHLLHYSALIKRFGPPNLYTNFRYERVHQFGKRVGRSTKCFINPSISIHNKKQIRRAIYDTSSDFTNIDFWPKSPDSVLQILFSLPPGESHMLKSTESPFPTNQNILRSISPGQWLQVSSFHLVNDIIFCKGLLFVLNLMANSENNFDMKEIVTDNIPKFISIQFVHYSKDFLFSFNETYYVQPWIKL